MSIEQIRLNGMKDRRLEVGKKRGKSTPFKEGDMGIKATRFKALVEEAIVPTMALEGMSEGRGTKDMIDAQVAQIRAIRGNAVRAGIGMQAFDLRVKMKVEEIKEQAKQEAEDAALAERIRRELTQQADADRQAELGDVPPNINWGNHAKKDDAGGFEPRRRGW